MPENWSDIFIRFMIIGSLIFANAFFVASEISLVSVRKTRIQQLSKEGNASAKMVNQEFSYIDRFIAAVQLGITMASLGLGWVGESTLASLFYPLFSFFPKISRLITVHTLAALVAFISITVMHVVMGELIPKSIGLRYPENISLIVARPMTLIIKIFGPFIFILNSLARGILKILNIPPAEGVHLVHSAEELDMLVSASFSEGILNATERDMLHNVFKFSDLIARQIMIPRLDMVSIPSTVTLDELTKFVYENQFTRYPVYERDLDHIKGIIHLKDTIQFIEKKENFNLKSIIRKVMFVPETLTIDKLLLDFKKTHSQMSIVIDEFGTVSGLATLEDVSEEIFGDVQDEFDIEEADVKTISENEFLVNAMLRIDEFNELFNMDIQEEEIETIGGLVLKELGRIANVGDQVRIGNLLLTVDSVEGARITKLKIKNLVKKI